MALSKVLFSYIGMWLMVAIAIAWPMLTVIRSLPEPNAQHEPCHVFDAQIVSQYQ